MRILAIDVGTRNVGWAVGSPDEKPRHGIYQVPSYGKKLGILGADIRAWLTATALAHKPTSIAYEQPIYVPDNNPWTMRKVAGIGFTIEVFGYDNDILVEEMPAPTVRKHFLAPHKVPRESKAIKEAVVARCRQLGWAPTEGFDDDADAMALLDYTLAVKDSPLLRKIGELL